MKQLSDAFRRSLVAFVATGIVVGVTVLICEVGFRTLLFSQVAFMEKFRVSGLYTDYFSDDWWKFYYAFNKPVNDTAKQPHPLLGWAGEHCNAELHPRTIHDDSSDCIPPVSSATSHQGCLS